MAFQTDSIMPSGGMNKDLDLSLVPKSDYTDALNIQHITDGGATSYAIQNTKGNLYRFGIPATVVQNKQYKILIQISSGPLARQVTIYNAQGTSIGVVNWTDSATVLTTSYANFLAAFNAVIAASVPLQTSTASFSENHATVSLTTIAGFEYSIADTQGTNDTEVVVIQEAYDVSLTGQANIIGSYDLLGQLYIWSTPQVNLPSIIFPYTTLSVTAQASNVSGTLIRITTSPAHGLITGQVVVISGAVGAGAASTNGIWTITVINSTAFDLQGSVWVSNTIGDATVIVVSGGLVASNVVGTKIRITTPTAHGLITGQSIVISGASGAGGASTNGIWIVNVISTTAFDLQNSVWVSNIIGAAEININVGGVGEIGVAIYDADTDSFTYTTLIKSKEFNFRRPKQIDTYCEQNNFQTSLYWTDDYNVPRVLYYRGAFITNGTIEIINSDGLYAYGTIGSETKLILTNELLGFSFTQQLPSGGGIKSGNWRYAIRLLTSTFNTTNWTELSNPVNVYLADQTGAQSAISGDDALVVTGKINEFTVTNLPVGVFEFIELAAINYLGTAIVGSIVNRFVISDTTMTIQHTGTEANVVNLDISTLNQFSFDIETAKNIDAIDNRLILSKLTTAQEIDFSAWIETWTHSLKYSLLTPLNYVNTSPQRVGAYEYQNPINVYNTVGYMRNDTYRIGAKFLLKSTGSFTKVFWIDDIRIDASSVNINPGRRVAGLPNMNLTDVSDNVQIPYIEINGISLSATIDGVSVRDLVSSIHFERVERVKEILITGQVVVAVTGGAATITGTGPFTTINYGGGASYGEYTFIAGDFGGGVPTAYPSGWTPERTLAKMYSPDIFCGQATMPTWTSGDKFINFGQPRFIDQVAALIGGEKYDYEFSEYDGYYNFAPATISLTAAQRINDNGAGVNSISILAKTYIVGLTSLDPTFFNQRGGVVLGTSATFAHINAGTDYGFYYGQYYRAITYTNPDSNKYGNRNSSVYIPTGASLTIDSSVSSPTLKAVYGGDVFTEKTYIKVRAASGSFGFFGGGGGVAFYSENVVNSQMIKKYNSSSSAWIYPNTTVLNWLGSTPGNLGTENAIYNKGYNIENGISIDASFDSNLPDQSDLPTEIRWSDLKPQNSVIDNFRVFLPLNFKDLPLTFGEITHHMNFNGELFTFQLRCVQRQYFNTRGTMEVGGGANTAVLIGDGSVMSRDGQTVTVIGTGNKWSVLKGKSAQGNDVAYWINTELKKVMRMGYDGTISIADIHGLQSFFANNLKWVNGKDTPADGQGICAVWDDRYMAAIWTIMGIREESLWGQMIEYSEGDVVLYTPMSFSTFNRTGELYVALDDIPAGSPGNDPTPLVWGVTGGPTGYVYIIDFTHNVTLGFAPWNVNLNTTMADLVTSLNTNVNPDPLNPIWAGLPPFDNSSGYTCSWSIGLQQMTLTTPLGVGATYNNANLFFAYSGGAGIALTPSQNRFYSGGVDPVVNDPPEDNVLWQLIPHTDNNYYNEYTIEFNEQKNKFTTFYTFKPKIYLKWTDTFLSPRPISDTGLVFEHRLGNFCVWYTDQPEDAYVEMIYNQGVNNSKMFLSTWFYGIFDAANLLGPSRIDIYTKRHQTFMLAVNSENNLDYFSVPIYNDILTSSNGAINTEDTTKIFGEYVKVKVTLPYVINTLQKVVDVVLKFLSQSRQSNK